MKTLTIKEIKMMVGKPIYIETLDGERPSHWVIYRYYYDARDWANKKLHRGFQVVGGYGSECYLLIEYGKTWIAKGYKEEEQK